MRSSFASIIVGVRHIAAYINSDMTDGTSVSEPRMFGKYLHDRHPEMLLHRSAAAQNIRQNNSILSRDVIVYIENAVLPLIPYPRLFILSAVSIAFSSDHVTMIEKQVRAHFIR